MESEEGKAKNHGTHMVSSTISVMPEQLLADMHFSVTFPEGVPQIDLQETNFNAQDLSRRTKQLGDRYYQLLGHAFNPDDDFFNDEDAFAIYMSLLGLTCELYLKCILYRSQTTKVLSWIKGHYLSNLHNQVPEKTQQEIEANFASCFPEKNFKTELQNMDLYFERFRYVYEIDGYSVNLYTAQTILSVLRKCTEQKTTTDIVR